MDQVIPETPESRAEEEPERTRRSLEDFGGFHRQASEDEIDGNFFSNHFLPPLDHTINDDDDDDALLYVSDNKEKTKITENSATPPETPDVSDGSISSSSNSMQASHHIIPHHHQPIQIAYNPITCYSPNTPRRSYRETLTSYDPPASVHMHPPRRLDSEAELEEVSREIRNDLLQREMLELAAHAEQAADAGEEHFSAKPCVFSDDITPKPSSLMQRRFSDGFSAQRQERSPRRRTVSVVRDARSSSYFSKLPLVQLRDVKEVFPSFQSFHANLRTHMYRNNVSQLLFAEETKRAPIQTCHSSESEQRKLAFQNFRLCRWRKPQKSIGELISGHLATDAPSSRPKIAVPPGLDEDTTLQASPSKPTYSFATEVITQRQDGKTLALVDSESADDQSMDADELEQPMVFSTPLIDRSRPKSNSICDENFQDTNAPDFVTPMRLRSIRRPRNLSRGENNMFENLMLPANSISEDSPMRKKQHNQAFSMETVLDVSDSLADSRDSSSIVLPDFNSSADRLNNTSTFSSGGKLKRRSIDPLDLPASLPSPIQSSRRCGHANFHESYNSLLDHGKHISRESSLNTRPIHLNQLPESENDDDEVDIVRKAATVDEPSSYWTQQRRRHYDALTSAFGVPLHDSSSKSEKGHRALYVRASENDDFLNNFLYCSKTDKGETETEVAEGCEACNDTGFTCGEPNTGFCCTSILNETLGVNMLFAASVAYNAGNLVRLGPSPHCAKDTETWLDVANERFDAAFDSFIGNVDPNKQRHNFRAPTLRKRNEIADISEDEGDDEQKFREISRYDLDGSSNAQSNARLPHTSDKTRYYNR